jgi:hypothetical protein
MMSRQPLFRAQAFQRCAQGRAKTVLPRLVAPPVLLCLWLLLGLLLLTTALAWHIQVPLYTRALGALLPPPAGSHQATGEVQAILFVPATSTLDLRVGAAFTGQIVLTGESFVGTIARVQPGVISPEQARQQYALTGNLALVITSPSLVVQVRIAPTFPAAGAGLSITAQVPVGAQSLLSWFSDVLRGLVGGY